MWELKSGLLANTKLHSFKISKTIKGGKMTIVKSGKRVWWESDLIPFIIYFIDVLITIVYILPW